MRLVGYALKEATLKDRVEFDAVQADWCDVQCAAANLLVCVIDGLLYPLATLAPCAGKIANQEAGGRQSAADDRVHEICQRESQSVRLCGARPGHSGAQADEKGRQLIEENKRRFFADHPCPGRGSGNVV
jgi:hypothetical protein